MFSALPISDNVNILGAQVEPKKCFHQKKYTKVAQARKVNFEESNLLTLFSSEKVYSCINIKTTLFRFTELDAICIILRRPQLQKTEL